MKPHTKHLFVNSIVSLVSVLTVSLTSAQDNTAQGGEASVDSVRTYPAKLSSHSTWERIVSFPGAVVNLPFKLFFGGVAATVKYAQEAPSLATLRELLVPKIRIRGVLPTASGRSGVGLKYYINHIAGQDSRLTFNVKHGLFDRRQKHYIELRDIPFGGDVYATTKVEYRIFHNESFFGIGPDSDFDDRSVYDLERTTAEFKLAYKANARTNLLLFSAFGNHGVQPGEHDKLPLLSRVSGDSLFGLASRTKLFSFGLELNHDSRDNRALTHTGWQIQSQVGLTGQVDGSEYKYWNLLVDIRRYIHLFYGRRLALRVSAERRRPLSNRQVPFFDLSELGSRETIRGYSRGRFRDLDRLMLSAEYRYPIWHYFDWVLFLDGGQVSRDLLKNFELGDFKLSYGGGFLIHSRNEPILQVIVGASEDQVRFYVVLN